MTTERMLRTHPHATTADVVALARAVDATLACAAACTTCADACLEEDSVEQLRT